MIFYLYRWIKSAHRMEDKDCELSHLINVATRSKSRQGNLKVGTWKKKLKETKATKGRSFLIFALRKE